MELSMRETLERADEVKPVARVGGVDLVTFEDQVVLAEASRYEKKPLPVQTLNADGSIARSRYTNAAISLGSYFINRYKAKAGKLYVVTDYRAIQGQAANRVYLSQIPCYVFKRGKDTNGNKGPLEYEGVVQISDQEFVSDFTRQLNREAMEAILPLIYEVGEDYESDALPI